MFYDNLKKICEKQNLKITNIVIECGGAPGSINGWKKGSMPNSNIVVALAMRLNVSTDYLLLGKEYQPNTNNNIAYGNNSKVQINNDYAENEIYTELSKIITSLPLRERSKLIAMIYDCDEQYRKSGSMQIPQATDLPVIERQLLETFRQFNDYEQAKVLERIKEWLDVKHRREHTDSQRATETQTPKPEFSAQTRIVARSFDGTYESRLATPEELEKMKLLKDAPEPEY